MFLASDRSDRSYILGGPAKSHFNYDKVEFVDYCMRLVYKDVPAFREEPFITTYKDYIAKINFELGSVSYPNQPVKPIMGSWGDVNRLFDESGNFGDEVRGNSFLKKIVDEITAAMCRATLPGTGSLSPMPAYRCVKYSRRSGAVRGVLICSSRRCWRKPV